MPDRTDLHPMLTAALCLSPASGLPTMLLAGADEARRTGGDGATAGRHASHWATTLSLGVLGVNLLALLPALF